MSCYCVALALFDLSDFTMAGSDAVRTSDAATMQAETTASSNEWTAFEVRHTPTGLLHSEQPHSACFTFSWLPAYFVFSITICASKFSKCKQAHNKRWLTLSWTAVGAALRRDHAQGRYLPHIAAGGQPHLRAGACAHPAGPAARSAHAVYPRQPAAGRGAQTPK